MPFFRLQHAGCRSQWQLVKYLKFWQSPNYSTSSRVSIPRTISREIHGANGKMWGIFVLASDSSRTLDSPKAKKMGRVKRKTTRERWTVYSCWDWDLIRSVFLGIGSTICRLGILQRCWWGWLVLVPGGCGYTEFKCGRRPFFLFRWMLRIGGTATIKKKPCLWGKKRICLVKQIKSRGGYWGYVRVNLIVRATRGLIGSWESFCRSSRWCMASARRKHRNAPCSAFKGEYHSKSTKDTKKGKQTSLGPRINLLVDSNSLFFFGMKVNPKPPGAKPTSSH